MRFRIKSGRKGVFSMRRHNFKRPKFLYLCPERHAPLQRRVVLQVATDGFTHHGVFAHEHDGLAPQGQTDGLHLLGADIVCAHDEALWEVIQQLLHKNMSERT